MPEFIKFGVLNGSGDQERFEYPHTWSVQDTTGPARLFIAPRNGHVRLLIDLLAKMPEPFGLLYVLVVTRSDAPEGRYQAESMLTRDEIVKFLQRYEEFLEQDGRHNIWLRSMDADTTFVYDRHNMIYVYGDIEAAAAVLTSRQMEIDPDVKVPVHHAHNYHDKFDELQDEILQNGNWIHSPLRDNDI